MNLRLLFFLLFTLSISQNITAQIGFPYCEPFDGNSTQDATVFGADARLVNGALRLTSNQESQRGFVYIDIPFSSTYGIKTSFEYFSYGGDGADGLTFFLFDAAVPQFAIGGFGGSLGYSKRNEETGLAGAYMGVGFDEFGNFGSSAEQKNGGFPGVGTGLASDAIVIRGPGNGFAGYEFITGKRTMQSGSNGLEADQQFPISSGGIGTNRVTDPNKPGYRKVNLTLLPNPTGTGYLITLVMDYTIVQGEPRTYTIFQDYPYPYPAPANLKLGFSGSTGGQTNFHEIKNLLVEVANEDDLENPVGVDFSDVASCEGQENTYSIEDEEVELPNENSSIRCLQFYGALADIEEESEDICSQGKCREENRVLELPQGTFKAGADGGEYTFFPNPGFRGQEFTVYYTITDNYGKSSTGNSMTFKINESPEPVKIIVDGSLTPVEEVRLCGGESVKLFSQGDEVYERYEWYKDGVLIEDEVSADIVVATAGEFKILAYNSKGCPAISNKVLVTFPEFPEFIVTTPVVGCDPGQSVDLTSSISNYDPDTFDYRLTGMGDEYLNDEMKEVFVSGEYDIQIKYKDLDCYSSAKELEVVILEEALVSDFEFEVQGTGVKGEEDGGFFPDDVIQFTDLSDDDAVSWSWDFGDGAQSSDKNATHIYGKKGSFDVKLTIQNEYGCETVATKRVSILRSYRLMVPTGFTPLRTDNEFFVPKYKGLTSAELLVFNLWGELIFQETGLDLKGWDGKLDGVLMNAGVYIYRFNGVAVDGEQVKSSGKFKLIR